MFDRVEASPLADRRDPELTADGAGYPDPDLAVARMNDFAPDSVCLQASWTPRPRPGTGSAP